MSFLANGRDRIYEFSLGNILPYSLQEQQCRLNTLDIVLITNIELSRQCMYKEQSESGELRGP